MDKINNIADCLYLSRVSKRLTQADLSMMADCSTAMVCSIEAGKRIPSIEMIVKIAKALDISQDFLFSCASDDLKKEIEKLWTSE